MSKHDNTRPNYDTIITKIADYVCEEIHPTPLALKTAGYCLADSIGCAYAALEVEACQKLLGPWVHGEQCSNSVYVPGTPFELDPIKAAFDITALIRWLDYNDTWLAKEWGHPSDNIGAILASMAFVSNRSKQFSGKVFSVYHILLAMIKAYEIQGIMALDNAFNAKGIDHVILVKLASTAVVAKVLGANKGQIKAAVSQVWLDGNSLRTYRHAPNTGSRKSWAAGDATSRAMRIAIMTLRGEEGYPSSITAPTWGFNDACFGGDTVKLAHEFDQYVMENILFKVAYPAEFHAQTAVECAFKLHPYVNDSIQQIRIYTQEAGNRIINKTGMLYNFADRDHCIQYMVAIGLLKGSLEASDYHDEMANDPRVDVLRDKMVVAEDPRYTEAYFDATKRAIPNRIEITFNDGTVKTEESYYPLGHKNRRDEAIPELKKKLLRNCGSKTAQDVLLPFFTDENLSWTRDVPVTEFLARLRG